MKKVIAIIENSDDGCFSIYAPELENVIIGSGSTVAEAKEDFANSCKEMTELYIKNGAVPEELKDIEFEFHYDFSAFSDAHSLLSPRQK